MKEGRKKGQEKHGKEARRELLPPLIFDDQRKQVSWGGFRRRFLYNQQCPCLSNKTAHVSLRLASSCSRRDTQGKTRKQALTLVPSLTHARTRQCGTNRLKHHPQRRKITHVNLFKCDPHTKKKEKYLCA